jgi:hypothetical protein
VSRNEGFTDVGTQQLSCLGLSLATVASASLVSPDDFETDRLRMGGGTIGEHPPLVVVVRDDQNGDLSFVLGRRSSLMFVSKRH